MKISALLTLLLVSPVCAQDTGNPANPAAVADKAEPNAQEVKDFIKRIDAMIQSREERSTRLLNEMRDRDLRIESGIKSLAAALESSTDSQQSKTRVSRLKKEFMMDLGKAAQAYARKRAELEEAFKSEPNQYTREKLFAARGKIDDRIDGLVNDMVGVAATFDAHQDLEKYKIIGESDYDSRWGDGWDTIYQDNPEYEQNRRASRAGNQTRNAATEALDKSIERLDLRGRDITEKLKAPNLTEDNRKLLNEELTRVNNMKENRVAQRASIVGAGANSAPTTPLSLDAAMAMQDELETSVADLRKEFVALFNTFGDWKDVQSQLGDYIMRRDRATAWLAEKSGN